MIHFDFVVSDEEAHDIFGCISEEIANLRTEISEMRAYQSKYNYPEAKIAWMKRRIEYLQNLKSKMHNSHVPDVSEERLAKIQKTLDEVAPTPGIDLAELSKQSIEDEDD